MNTLINCILSKMNKFRNLAKVLYLEKELILANVTTSFYGREKSFSVSKNKVTVTLNEVKVIGSSCTRPRQSDTFVHTYIDAYI